MCLGDPSPAAKDPQADLGSVLLLDFFVGQVACLSTRGFQGSVLKLNSRCFIIGCEFLVRSCGVTSHPQILATSQAVTAHIASMPSSVSDFL